MRVLILSVMTSDAVAFLSAIACGNCASLNSSLSPSHLCHTCGLSFIKRISTAVKMQGRWSCGNKKSNGKVCYHFAYPSESTVYLHQYSCGRVTRDEVLLKRLKIQLLVIAKCLWCKLRDIIITSSGGLKDEKLLRKDFYRSFLQVIRSTFSRVFWDEFPNGAMLRSSLALMSPNCLAAIRTRFSLDPDAMATFDLNCSASNDKFYQLFPDDITRPIISRRVVLMNKRSSWFPNLLTTYPTVIHVILQELIDLLKDPILDGPTLLAKVIAARVDLPFHPPSLSGSDCLNLMEKISAFVAARSPILNNTNNSMPIQIDNSLVPIPSSSPHLSSTPQVPSPQANRSKITDESVLLATVTRGLMLDTSSTCSLGEGLLRNRGEMREIIGSPPKYTIPMDDTAQFENWLGTWLEIFKNSTEGSLTQENGSFPSPSTSNNDSLRDGLQSTSSGGIWSRQTQPVTPKE